jgi:hypothetical protein
MVTMTKRTGEEAKLNYIEKMGPELGPQFYALWQELLWLRLASNFFVLIEEAKHKGFIMPWRKHALELAAQIRAEDPSVHSLNVSAEIVSRWRHDPERCPGTGKLRRAIREWEEKGKLAPANAPPSPGVHLQQHQKVRKRKK